MKLGTFGINKERNLIVQFPVSIQPYIQYRWVPLKSDFWEHENQSDL